MSLPPPSPIPAIQQQMALSGGALPFQGDDLRPVLNCARHTEDLSWAYYGKTSSVLEPETIKALVDGRFIKLQRVSGSIFGAVVRFLAGSSGLTPFVAGTKYLVSLYVYSVDDHWFFMRDIASSSVTGHGPKYTEGGKLRRVWNLSAATSTTALDQGASASVALGSGAGANPVLVQQALNPALNLYIGGFQIEAVASTTKDGVAAIGDSTLSGSSGKKDAIYNYQDPNLVEITTVLAALLNVPVYNRAVGGETLAQMDARWATDMTPLAVNAKYALIQGGVNDPHRAEI